MAGVQGLLGLVQLAQSAKQKQQANKLAAKTIRPDYELADPIMDNQALAESRASQGLSDAARTVYESNANRAQTTSIDAILMGGGNINSVADLYDRSQNNFAQLALLEDEVRQKNTQTLVRQNERLAEELDKQFQVNDYAPYMNNVRAIESLRAASAQNFSGALNTIGSAAGNYMLGNIYQKDIQGVFGRGGQPPSSTATLDRNIPPPTPSIGNDLGSGGLSGNTNPVGFNPYIEALMGRYGKRPTYEDYMHNLLRR